MVNSSGKKVLVEAEPGTGKTYTAVSAAVDYIRKRKSINPNFNKKALILTFSKNARAQISRQLVDLHIELETANLIEITNFHSFYQKYLWAYSNKLGFDTSNLIIVSENLRRKLFAEIFADLGVYDVEDYDHFTWADNLLEENLFSIMSPKVKKKLAILQEKEAEFIQRILEVNSQGYIAFSDMGYHMIRLLEKSGELRRLISIKYPLLVIDEFQDVSDKQNKLIELIVNDSSNVLYFADSNQQIYEWRGAKKSRLSDLRSKFQDIEFLEFQQNYRYGSRDDIKGMLENIKTGNEEARTDTVNIKYVNVPVSVDKLTLYSNNSKHLMIGSMAYHINRYIPKDYIGLSIGILCKTNMEVELIKKKLLVKYGKRCRNINNNSLEHNIIGEMIEFINKNVEVREELSLYQEAFRFLFDIIDSTKIGSLKNTDVRQKTIENFKRLTSKIAKDICDVIEVNRQETDLFGLYQGIYEKVKKSDMVELVYELRPILRKIFSSKKSTDEIQSIFLQHQHLQAHKDLEGIYILNHHQSKGREFTQVIVVNEQEIRVDKNLHYVALSRAREKIFCLNWVKA